VSCTGFDSTYHAFPVAITKAVGLTQTQTVDVASGKPTAVWDANGNKPEYPYDTFKRLEKVIKPYDNSSYPTLQYGYGSIPSPFIRNGNMERPGDWILAAGNATVGFQTDQPLIGAYSLAITKTDASDVAVVHTSQTTPVPGASYVVSANIWRPNSAAWVILAVCDGRNTFAVAQTGETTGSWEWLRGVITTTTSPTPTEFTVQLFVIGSAGSTVRVDDVQASAPYAVQTDKRETSGQSGTVYSRNVYNGLGQLVQTQAELNATQEVFQDLTYSSSGWKTSESVPYATTLPQGTGMPWKIPASQPSTSYASDALGRITTVTNSDGTTVQTAYQDWKTAVSDENGHEKITEVDAFGRTAVITETTGSTARRAGPPPSTPGPATPTTLWATWCRW